MTGLPAGGRLWTILRMVQILKKCRAGLSDTIDGCVIDIEMGDSAKRAIDTADKDVPARASKRISADNLWSLPRGKRSSRREHVEDEKGVGRRAASLAAQSRDDAIVRPIAPSLEPGGGRRDHLAAATTAEEKQTGIVLDQDTQAHQEQGDSRINDTTSQRRHAGWRHRRRRGRARSASRAGRSAETPSTRSRDRWSRPRRAQPW